MGQILRDRPDGIPNFYLRYKRRLLESMIEGSCLNVAVQGHITTLANAVNTSQGLANLPYADNSFDTVICSDLLGHIGAYRRAVARLLQIARKKVIIAVPACKWLYGKYDRAVGRKRRYSADDFTGFEITHLFWFLVPISFLRKFFALPSRPLPGMIDGMLFRLSELHLNFGVEIVAVKYKVASERLREHKISVFVPVFNEEKIIERSIKAISCIMGKLDAGHEIFIVNDSSKDKTELVAERLEQSDNRIKVLSYEVGPTRRENLARSFKRAGGDIILFVDVDLVASLRFLPDLIGQIILGCDISIGSRYVSGSKIRRKPFRLFVSLIYNAFIRIAFRTRIHDHMCGFKAFKREVVLRLVDEMGYDESLRRGIFWDAELLIRARRKGYSIKEIPILWKERRKSALNFRREIRTVGYIFEFLLKSPKKRNGQNRVLRREKT